MRRDEVADALRPRRRREREVRRSEHRDEELDIDLLARQRIDEVRPLARVVDEALLACAMHLPKHDALPADPRTVAIAERRVPEALRVRLQVFEMEQLEGHTRAPELTVDPRRVRLRAIRRSRVLRPAVEPFLERRLVHRVYDIPRQPCRSRAALRLAYDARARARRA